MFVFVSISDPLITLWRDQKLVDVSRVHSCLCKVKVNRRDKKLGPINVKEGFVLKSLDCCLFLWPNMSTVFMTTTSSMTTSTITSIFNVKYLTRKKWSHCYRTYNAHYFLAANFGKIKFNFLNMFHRLTKNMFRINLNKMGVYVYSKLQYEINELWFTSNHKVTILTLIYAICNFFINYNDLLVVICFDQLIKFWLMF